MKAAQRNFELGQGTRTDVDEARVRLDQANVQALQLRQQARYSQQQLALTLNQPINTLVPVDPSLLLAKVPSKNLQSYIDLAHQNNPEAESGRAKLEIAKLEVAKAQSAHFPTLDLITQRSYSKSENVLTPMASYNTAQTGVQLNVPLFSGGYVNSTIRQSTYALERETQVLEQTLRNLSLQVRKEYQNISEGMARIQAMEQSERSSAQLVLSTQKGVMAGTRTVTDVLNAFQRLAESRRDLAQARYQYLLAHQKLLLLSGESTTDVVLQINKMLSGSISLSSALP
jgi:outer membrane protein TolC